MARSEKSRDWFHIDKELEKKLRADVITEEIRAAKAAIKAVGEMRQLVGKKMSEARAAGLDDLAKALEKERDSTNWVNTQVYAWTKLAKSGISAETALEMLPYVCPYIFDTALNACCYHAGKLPPEDRRKYAEQCRQIIESRDDIPADSRGIRYPEGLPSREPGKDYFLRQIGQLLK